MPNLQDTEPVYLYTDGACSGNPGPGGWGAILEYKGVRRELSGGEPSTTNNRMELTAVIKGLEALKRPCRVILTSDSRYVLDALRLKWAHRWRENGWMRTKTDPTLNADLWARLLELYDIHLLEYRWVRGHNGHPENERCDAMAVAQAKKYGMK